METLLESSFLVPLAAATAAGLLAGGALLRPWGRRFHRVLAGVLLATAAVEGANAAILAAADGGAFWHRLALSVELVRMALLFQLGATLVGRSGEKGAPWAVRWARLAAVVAGVGLAVTWWGAGPAPGDAGGHALAPLERFVLALLLVGLVLAVSQFELLLRSSSEAFRYQLKYVLLGLGSLVAFEIYLCAQALLLGTWQPMHGIAGGVVTLISLGLVAFGLGRMRLVRTVARVTVSPQMVYGSMSLLAVGLYLLAVGLVGELLRLTGQGANVGLADITVFLLTVALVVGLLSRAFRARFRAFVSRNLLRSRYDYRVKWLETTDAFRAAETEDEILDRLLDLLARTFGTGHLSIWMRYEADGLFHQVRSTNIEPPPPPLDADHPGVAALASSDAPVGLEGLSPYGRPDAFLEATQAVLGVPVRGAGELRAFIVLGPAPGGGRYDTDDRDLLRAIAHHAGVLLAHAGLADERQAAAEIDALNRFAAFYLHDFKNLTARLSLVAQNAKRHGDDPEFRASALETVGRTAEQMKKLIAGLAHRSPELGRVKTVDLRDLAESTVKSLGPDFGAVVEPARHTIPPVLAVREQLQQVVLNLVLNARRALDSGSQGTRRPVRVFVGGNEERVHLEVIDDGPGIAPEELRTLFQPFRSESGGFGIGLYESKRIVESYGGRLRVASTPGQGTRVTVELPALAPEAGVGQTATALEGQQS